MWRCMALPAPDRVQSLQAAYLPTNSSSLSEARGWCFFQMSIVKSVELLLKMEVSEDIKAAIMTAIMSPRRPVTHRWTDPFTHQKSRCLQNNRFFKNDICGCNSHHWAWVQWPVWERQCWNIPPLLHTHAHTLLDPRILRSLKNEAEDVEQT